MGGVHYRTTGVEVDVAEAEQNRRRPIQLRRVRRRRSITQDEERICAGDGDPWMRGRVERHGERLQGGSEEKG